MLPTCQLVAALTGFREAFPTVTLRLYTEALGSVTRLVLDRVCTIGACGPLPGRLDELISRPLGAATIIPVAAPSHPLAAIRGPISSADVRDHVQLVLTDRSESHRGRRLRRPQPSDVAARRSRRQVCAAAAGVGLGRHAGAPGPGGSLRGAAGAARRAGISGTPLRLFGLYRADSPPGPAARWLLDRLGSEVGAAELQAANPPSAPALADLLGAR